MKQPSKSKSVFWRRNSLILLRFQIESFWPEFAYFQRSSTFWKKRLPTSSPFQRLQGLNSGWASFAQIVSLYWQECLTLCMKTEYLEVCMDWNWTSFPTYPFWCHLLQERWLFWWLWARFPRGRVCPRWQMGREWPNTCYQRRADWGNDGKKTPQGGMFLRQLEQGNNTENFPNRARFVDMCGKTSPFLLHTYKKVEFLRLLWSDRTSKVAQDIEGIDDAQLHQRFGQRMA